MKYNEMLICSGGQGNAFLFVYLCASPGHLGFQIHSALFHCSALQGELSLLCFSCSCVSRLLGGLGQCEAKQETGKPEKGEDGVFLPPFVPLVASPAEVVSPSWL